MNSKTCSTVFFVLLISSTMAIIPEGEIQIGPIIDPHTASRFFGHKHFEGLFKPIDKPHLAKKVLLGVGALGAGALAAGGAALLANKLHHHKGAGFGFGGGHSQQPSYAPSYGGSGWGGWSSGYNTNNNNYGSGYTGSHSSGIAFPSSGSSNYYSQPQVDYSQAYSSAQASSGESYPSSSYYDSSYNYNGWSR